MSANPVANGGLVKKPLKLLDFRDYKIEVPHSGTSNAPSMSNMAVFLRDIIQRNMTNFRLFGPDETESNKFGGVYKAGKRFGWEDADGGNLAPEGCVMEMLSEHTCEGWLEGYVLSGRHGLLDSYEPFIHIIDSKVNQHCKGIEKCLEVEWRAKVASLNILLTATVWRQDHNSFTHHDLGFLDVVANKSPEVVRIYLPPDGNCLLSCMDHCFRSNNYVNVIVADKQDHLQYLDMEAAIEHCTKGAGIWALASNDQATALLRQYIPELKIRIVNVFDLFKLIPHGDHPHGLTDTEVAAIFTDNKPVIFNFHSYPWLIRRLTFNRKGCHSLKVHGYNEKRTLMHPSNWPFATQRIDSAWPWKFRQDAEPWQQGFERKRNCSTNRPSARTTPSTRASIQNTSENGHGHSMRLGAGITGGVAS
ncbi:hypothetical protein LTR80_012084 [Exophiala xenobiotica]